MARGFGLLEVLIALAIVAILASIAVPGYSQALQRSRRVEARSALMQVQLAQERHRSAHATYAPDLGALGIDADAAPHYRLAIVDSGSSRFSVVATATGAQAADTSCAQLGLTLDGGTLTLHANGGTREPTCWRR